MKCSMLAVFFFSSCCVFGLLSCRSAEISAFRRADRCESDQMQIFLLVFLELWIRAGEGFFNYFFFSECLGCVDEAPAEELSGCGSVICGLIIARAAWLNFPPLLGLRKHTHTHPHTHFLVFVTHSPLSLSLSLTPACLYQMCLSVFSFNLY